MKFVLLFTILLFQTLTTKTYCLTQAEALDQVKKMNMTEKEYVERSLKTILYLDYFNQNTEDTSENLSEFLPFEIWKFRVNKASDKFAMIHRVKSMKEGIFTKDFSKKYLEYYIKAINKKEKFECRGLSLPNCLEDPVTPFDKNISIIKLEKNLAILERKNEIKEYKYIEKGIYVLKKENGIWKLDGIDCYFIAEKYTHNCSINFHNHQSSER